MKKGRFISFEGIEGAGKSTQIRKLEHTLHERGYNVLTLREPGGTDFGESLRQAILSSGVPIDPLAEAHLFCASRAQLLVEKILPHLKHPNNIVLVDRFIDSSFVYQGYARGLGLEVIEQLHSHFPLSIRPDLTFYFHIDFETSLERQAMRAQNKDYFEKENKVFYTTLINAYQDLCTIFPDRIKRVDASQSAEYIAHHLLAELIPYLEAR